MTDWEKFDYEYMKSTRAVREILYIRLCEHIRNNDIPFDDPDMAQAGAEESLLKGYDIEEGR